MRRRSLQRASECFRHVAIRRIRDEEARDLWLSWCGAARAPRSWRARREPRQVGAPPRRGTRRRGLPLSLSLSRWCSMPGEPARDRLGHGHASAHRVGAALDMALTQRRPHGVILFRPCHSAHARRWSMSQRCASCRSTPQQLTVHEIGQPRASPTCRVAARLADRGGGRPCHPGRTCGMRSRFSDRCYCATISDPLSNVTPM